MLLIRIGKRSSFIYKIKVRNSQSHWKQWNHLHQGAFGCGISKDKYSEFIEYSNEKLKDIDFSPFYGVDFIYQGYNLDNYEIMEIGNLEDLWGKGLDEPLVAIENITITKDNISLLSPDRMPTLKFELPNGISFIKFGASAEEYEELKSHERMIINVVGKCATNLYRGHANAQIMVEEYEVMRVMDYVL